METARYATYALLFFLAVATAWWASQFEIDDDAPPKYIRSYDQRRWFDGKTPFAIGILIAAVLAGAMVWLSKGSDIGISP